MMESRSKFTEKILGAIEKITVEGFDANRRAARQLGGLFFKGE